MYEFSKIAKSGVNIFVMLVLENKMIFNEFNRTNDNGRFICRCGYVSVDLFSYIVVG